MNDLVNRVKQIGERAIQSSRDKPATAERTIQIQMPLYPNECRIMPNALIRSALFNVNNPNAPRIDLKKEKLASIEGTEIYYTGEDLRQEESAVLLEIFHLARAALPSERIEFSGYALLKQLKWGSSGRSYERLVKILDRLQASSVTIKFNGGRKGFTGSLVRKFLWKDGTDTGGTDGKTRWIVYLEPEIISLFDGDDYTRFSIEQRQSLKSDLSKWLHSYYHSHDRAFAHSVAWLHKMCGSQTKELFHFRANLRRALKELVQKGFLSDWRIDKHDLVHVVRTGVRLAS